MHKLRKLLVVLLLLILLVQGFAAAYAPMHKLMSAQENAVMPCHDQHAAHAEALPVAHHGDNSMPGAAHDTDNTSHLCCQQIFSGATASAWPIAAHKFSDVPLFVLPLYTLFIPDSPDRPPRG